MSSSIHNQPLSLLQLFHNDIHSDNILIVHDTNKIPQPYRQLLMHNNLMTPTLSRHHQSSISLHVIHSVHDHINHQLSRCITLNAAPTSLTTTQLPFHNPSNCPYNQQNTNNYDIVNASVSNGLCDCFVSCSCFTYTGIVELGYITVYLNNIDNQQLCCDILDGHTPFGQLLQQYQINVHCKLQSIVQLDHINCNHNIFQLLGSSSNKHNAVYGRINQLYDGNNHLIADVIELLPSIHKPLQIVN